MVREADWTGVSSGAVMGTNEEIRFHDGDYYNYVPDGEYSAICIDYSDPKPFRGSRKVFLTFELLTEPYRGTRIFMAFNVGFNGVKPGSRYFKAWCLANGERLPSRNAVMSQIIFKGKRFVITTRTVKPLRANEEMGFDYWYSVVDSLKSLVMPDREEYPEC